MKNFRRAIVLFIMIFVFAATLPMAVFAADTDMRYGKAQLGKMDNSDALLYVYDCFVKGCETTDAKIKIDLTVANVSFDDIKLIYKMFYNDYPEYFWIDGAWNASSQGKEMTISPNYTLTGDALNTAKAEFDSKVNNMTSGLDGNSDYEKAKTLHDLLIDNTDYISGKNDQTAYGALVEGKAVCNGYARAYQYLLQKVAIPAWFITGKSYNPDTQENDDHSWNMVQLDGEWYYTDVTWDDQDENTFYTYFNITTEQLSDSHTPDAEYTDYLPKATATAANFYVKEDLVFDSFDQQKLTSLLRKGNNKTHLYISGNLSDFENHFKANVRDISIKLGGDGGYNYNINNLGRGWILDISISNMSIESEPESQTSSAISEAETSENSIAFGTPNGATIGTTNGSQASSDTATQSQNENSSLDENNSENETDSSSEAVSSSGNSDSGAPTSSECPDVSDPSDSLQQSTDVDTLIEDTEDSYTPQANNGILSNTLKWIAISVLSLLLIAGIVMMALKNR